MTHSNAAQQGLSDHGDHGDAGDRAGDPREPSRAPREEAVHLAPARDRFEDLYDTAPIGLCSLNEHGIVESANLAAARLFGVKRSQLIGRLLPLLARAEDRAALHSRLIRCVHDGVPLDRTITFHIGNRDPIALTIRGTRVVDPVRGTRSCRAALIETSATVRSDERQLLIASAASALASSFDYAATVSVVARQMVPTFADVCFVDLLQEDRFVRSDVAIALPTWRAAASLLRKRAPHPAAPTALRHVLRTGEPVLTIGTCSIAAILGVDEHGGPLAPHEASSLIIVPLITHGRIKGAMTFIMADSRRRYGAEDLSFARAIGIKVAMAVDNGDLYHEAREAVAAREELLSIVSHELRTPLASIAMSAADLLERTPANDRRGGRRRIESIARGTGRMARLVDDLLDFSGAPGQGRMPSLQLGLHAVHEIIDEVADAFRIQAAARRIDLCAAPIDPALTARCDRERIVQVLTNLVGNALKFTSSDGSVRVAAEAAGADVKITVSDTGSGIAAEDLPRIFDRYWRGMRSSGCGLGLYIAKSVVELHQGTIGVTSALGQGTTFTLTLPRNG